MRHNRARLALPALVLAGALVLALAAWGSGSQAPRQTVVFAFGDGADGGPVARALAKYVKTQKPDRFFYLGDV